MKPGPFLFFLIALAISIAACNSSLPPANRVFVVQPFADLPASQAKAVYDMLKKINPKTILRTAIPLPANAFYPQRKRYRADSIINYLNRSGGADTVIIGLTSKDISITKSDIADWGVMGLGFEPGNACVVSTFRLSKTELSGQLYKLSLHELGHTPGLHHCKNKTCFMRDAEGGNHLDEETGFCQSCKSFLRSKGWQLK
jgi:archaemetzincin